ncbi:LysR family transcriptional regulator [Roseomonas sp. NAR14]|uniref:LysR family transcriptional regulator n=1 Tax=Roseomonas acroporae TaxID=2937791 RepID=A0A9X2BZH7_9PROT|nr:LysR family transcriptional regulator [Roseomonas acroporae]MCK8787994.1 LysR family transcriptional regulator [Roseomonas acroporae]
MARLTDLRLLRNFLHVCEASSLATAALRANLSQPAISKQVAALEAGLGVRLLERHARGVRLTAAGEALRDRAAGLLRDAERVAAEVGAAAEAIRGEVAVGVVSSLRDLLVTPAVATFLRLHPDVRVRVLEGTSRAMRDAVLAGRADFAVIATGEEAAPLLTRTFIGEPLLAIAPPEAALRLERPLRLADLMGRPLVLVSAPNSIRTILDTALSRQGLRAEVRAEVENVATAMDLVRLGVGWSVFTYAAVARVLLQGEVSAAPLAELRINWALTEARERRASAAVTSLGALIEGMALDLIGRGSWATAHCIAGAGIAVARRPAASAPGTS